MSTGVFGKKDLYYTTDDQWINFQGTVAFAGVCFKKVAPLGAIHELHFCEERFGLKTKGEIIAVLTHKKQKIEVLMPMTGKLLEVNEMLLDGNLHILFEEAESRGWLAKFLPAQPYDRTGLLLPKQYQMNGKSKYAK